MRIVYIMYKNNLAIKNNNLALFVKNSQKDSFILNNNYIKYFYQSCLHNSLDISRWLFEDNNNRKQLISENNIINLIKNKKLDSLKFIEEKKIYIFNNKNLFDISCCYSFDISQWLLSLNLFQLDLEKENGLFNACINQQIKVIEWLINLKCNFRYDQHFIFKQCCKNKKLTTIKYLTSIYKGYDYKMIIFNNFLSNHVEIKPIIIDNLNDLYNQKNWFKIIEIFKLKTVNFSNSEECIISFQQANLCTPCNHYYDTSNFIRWILKKNICPYCRNTINLSDCVIDQKFYNQLLLIEKSKKDVNK